MPTPNNPSSPSSRPSIGGGVSPVRTTVYHVRRKPDAGFFTDSAIVYTLKTAWARLTTPSARAIYVDVGDKLLDRAAELLKAMGLLTIAFCRYGLALSRKTWEVSIIVGRHARKGAAEAQRSTARGARAVSHTGARAASGAASGIRLAFLNVVADVRSLALWGGRWLWWLACTPPRLVFYSLRLLLSALSHLLRVLLRFSKGLSRQSTKIKGSGARMRPAVVWMLPTAKWLGRGAGRAARLGLRFVAASPSLVWRYRSVPAYAFVCSLLLLGTPVVWDAATTTTRVAWERIASWSPPSLPSVTLPRISAPKISVPKVTVSKPDLPEIALPKISVPEISLPKLDAPVVTIRMPAFIAEPVSKIDDALASSLLEPGGRVLVADIAGVPSASGELGGTLALILEAELSRSRYFGIVPRERVLAARRGRGGADFRLTEAQALATSPIVGASALVTGQLSSEGESFDVILTVLDLSGRELFQRSARATREELPVAVRQVSELVRRRLGDPSAEADLPPAPVLSRSYAALNAYYRARAHLYEADYRSARAAATEAVRHDSAFALAFRLQAETHALLGHRGRARASLERAWHFRNRLSERERLRVTADRDALAGRYPAAILAYDRLFGEYRDDVGALKSQAILQEMIGVRGGGAANLDLAESIDPVDWPPLRRIARFLGYHGRLPTFETLAARTDI